MQNEPAFFHYLKRIADECNDVADVRSACHAATVKDGWPATFLKVTAKDDSVCFPEGEGLVVRDNRWMLIVLV